MQIKDKQGIFDFMKAQVEETAAREALQDHQAFPRWFINMFHLRPHQVFHSDGARDAKIDTFFRTNDGKTVTHHVVNSKYTGKYGKTAPPAFYDEALAFWQSFKNKPNRSNFLSRLAKQELITHYRSLYKHWDNGRAQLMFVTNCRKNANQAVRVDHCDGLTLFHFEELVQHIVDDYDCAMPRTAPLVLRAIRHVLSADTEETQVPTSIAFARLVDFITYMRADPYHLLLARNVRTYLGSTDPNKKIRTTFAKAPEEFVYSHNGITLLCEAMNHDAPNQTLTLENPRVVNGGQTLRSIRDADDPSKLARVMVRIITIRPPQKDVPREYQKRRDVIQKISERSNTQNPINSWDLRSTDDFQLDLYRYFRRIHLFYERRKNEWRDRSRELKSVGVAKGPNITEMSRWIACYHYERSRLGPVAAKKPRELADGEPYQVISKTKPAVAEQVYRVAVMTKEAKQRIAKRKKKVNAYKGSIDSALLSFIFKVMTEAKAQWGSPELTTHLREQMEDPDWRHDWDRLSDLCLRHIIDVYKSEAGKHWRAHHERLEPATFFKNQTLMDKLMAPRASRVVKKAARDIVG